MSVLPASILARFVTREQNEPERPRPPVPPALQILEPRLSALAGRPLRSSPAWRPSLAPSWSGLLIIATTHVRSTAAPNATVDRTWRSAKL